MIKTCVKLCENTYVNSVDIFVDFFLSLINMCKSTTFLTFFPHFFTPLFNSFSLDSHLKTFPLFHTPYYYNYDFFKINN